MARTKNLTNAGKGRPKGSKNKTTLAAKEMIQAAADRLGGLDRLVEWAESDEQNERMFWGTIYPKLLPLTVGGDEDNPLTVVTKIEITAPGYDDSTD